MTFLQTTYSEKKLVRVQEKGQVTLPAEVREKLGLKKGDLVSVTPTENGILITPQEIVATEALDKIGAVLRQKGLSLEKLIESGRKQRGKIIAQKYGLKASGKDR